MLYFVRNTKKAAVVSDQPLKVTEFNGKKIYSRGVRGFIACRFDGLAMGDAIVGSEGLTIRPSTASQVVNTETGECIPNLYWVEPA